MDATKVKIEISLNVYKQIEGNRASFAETHDQILARVLGCDVRSPTTANDAESAKGLWSDGTFLQDGLKLRNKVRATNYEAIVSDGAIVYDGKLFSNPSAAGGAAVGYNVNGWRWWQYFDVATNRWLLLDHLRRR